MEDCMGMDSVDMMDLTNERITSKAHEYCMEDAAYERRYECYIRMLEHGHMSNVLKAWLAKARHDMEEAMAQEYEEEHTKGMHYAL